jgi:hypothetical protein
MNAELVLALLRVERLRLSCIIADIDAIGIALLGNFITPAQAVEHMHDLGIVGPLAADVVAPERALGK